MANKFQFSFVAKKTVARFDSNKNHKDRSPNKFLWFWLLSIDTVFVNRIEPSRNNPGLLLHAVDPRGLEPLTCRMPCDRSAIELRAPDSTPSVQLPPLQRGGPRLTRWTWAELNRHSPRCERGALAN